MDPSDENLPDPGMSAKLHLRENEKLAIAKSDLDNFYPRAKLPDCMTVFFGLLSFRVDREELWPEACSLRIV